MCINLNLNLRLRLFSILFIMLSKFIEGMLLYSIINNFSVEYILHLVPHMYGLHFAIMSQYIVYSSLSSFKFQMYVVNLVHFLYVSLLMLLKWLQNLVLNDVSQDP